MNEKSCIGALEKYLEGTKLSYVYFHEATLADLSNYKSALCFVLAFWSSPAVVSLVRYFDFLSRVQLNPSVSLLILNTDGIPQFYDHPLLKGKIHGWSECFIWENGEITSENCAGRSLESLSNYLQENSWLG